MDVWAFITDPGLKDGEFMRRDTEESAVTYAESTPQIIFFFAELSAVDV